MKKRLTLFVLVVVATLAACKKNNGAAKLPFADIEFTLFDLRAAGDTTISEVAYPSNMVLKSNQTWTLELGGAKSNGTYTWTSTSNQQGELKFTVLSWGDLTSNQILSNKLRSALQSVNHCGYSLQNPSYANFYIDNYQSTYFPYVRTTRK